ncbi:Carboxylic ester hydrolase [Fusarium keratoplasticum]|uniref:Carboxylic ester hydrolase n=1 Tax=Fusarium keratoplasticum TaxID=1328300 RepID=A0ACC0QZZ9_9HYPO|nr:Carboxylic ester hydrolase [Fusarium keratoplasticum]KAI8670487.1 Carboxylic ester hydrolase [Fusarium keratoplasticum]
MKVLMPLVALLGTVTAQLQQITNFGSNPSGAKMFVHVPKNLPSNPAIVVAIHHCQGTAQSYYQSTPYAQLSDQKGFIVIYPESPYSGTCWDVSSKATMTHDGGANSNSIANMVRYALQTYKANPAKVFVTGSSSGAMMTNVMAATYPDLFAAGIVYSGVPAGCFFTNSVNGWNSDCAQGRVNKSPADWAKMVKDAYPGYNGARPKMQIYHGGADSILLSPNYQETIDQWAGVFGYNSMSPQSSNNNVPQAGYKTDTFGPKLVGIFAQNVGHSVPVRGADDMKFFGL